MGSERERLMSTTKKKLVEMIYQERDDGAKRVLKITALERTVVECEVKVQGERDRVLELL
jgi:hypothetical protein